MYKVTPPRAKPVLKQFAMLEEAIDELRWHMFVTVRSEDEAIRQEAKGETQFHFVTTIGVGHIEAVAH